MRTLPVLLAAALSGAGCADALGPAGGCAAEMARTRVPAVRDHVLLPWASRIREADAHLRPLLGEELFTRVLEQVPDDWLLPEPGIESPAGKRAGYVTYLMQRLEAASLFVEEAARAHANLV